MREKHYNIGKQGEFAIAQKVGDSVNFIFARDEMKHFNINNSEQHGLPMNLALQGKSGIVTGEDYSGVLVLAAYTFVPELHWGIVAKIPVAEVNIPYYKGFLIAAAIAILLLTLCVLLFHKISNPILKEHYRKRSKIPRPVQQYDSGVSAKRNCSG